MKIKIPSLAKCNTSVVRNICLAAAVALAASNTCLGRSREQIKLRLETFSESRPSPLPVGDSIVVQTIDAEQLRQKMASDLAASPNCVLQVVISSSTTCGGHQGALDYLNRLHERYGDSLLIYMVVGNPYTASADFYASAKRLSDGARFYVAADRYRAKGDDRRRADELTKELFPASRDRIIGTPKYYIVDRAGSLLYYSFGFARQNGLYDAIDNPVETFFEQVAGRAAAK